MKISLTPECRECLSSENCLAVTAYTAAEDSERDCVSYIASARKKFGMEIDAESSLTEAEVACDGKDMDGVCQLTVSLGSLSLSVD